MSQTRLASAIEAAANVVVGYAINVVANLVVLPWFGFDVGLGDSLAMGLIFTVISLARSYVLRRAFNRGSR